MSTWAGHAGICDPLKKRKASLVKTNGDAVIEEVLTAVSHKYFASSAAAAIANGGTFDQVLCSSIYIIYIISLVSNKRNRLAHGQKQLWDF